MLETDDNFMIITIKINDFETGKTLFDISDKLNDRSNTIEALHILKDLARNDSIWKENITFFGGVNWAVKAKKNEALRYLKLIEEKCSRVCLESIKDYIRHSGENKYFEIDAEES